MDVKPLPVAATLEKRDERFVAPPLHADQEGLPRRNDRPPAHRLYPNRGTPPSVPARYLG